MADPLTLAEVQELAFGAFLMGVGHHADLSPETLALPPAELLASLRHAFDTEWNKIVSEVVANA